MPGASISFSGNALQPVVARGLLRTLTDPGATDAQRERAATTIRPLLRLSEEASETEVTRALATWIEHTEPVGTVTEAFWNPLLHPRGRAGKFTKALSAMPDQSILRLPDGISIRRNGDSYAIDGRRSGDARQTALKALSKSARMTHPRSLGGKKSFQGLTEFEDWELHHPKMTKAMGTVAGNTAGSALATGILALLASDLQEAPADTGGAPGPKPNTGGAEAPAKAMPKGRGGKSQKKPAKAGQQNNDFERLHPRGRGGQWIAKGDGMGKQQPRQDVAQLQRRLQQLGYGPGAADGQFGDVTEASLSKFQTDYGLQPTGKLDPATLQTLQSPPSQKVGEIQAQNRALATLPNAQGQLPSTGHSGGSSAGVSSGSSGARTGGTVLNTNDPNAVRNFQRAHGLNPDGIIGPQTLQALNTGGSSTSGASRSGTNTSGGGVGNTPNVPNAPGGTTASGTRATASRQSSKTSKPLALGVGVSGNASPPVKNAQTALQALGYDLGDSGVDGRFGPDTKKAVQKLQRKYGLKVDGVIGPKTAKLIDRLATKLAKQGKKGNVTSADQQALFAAALDERRPNDQERLEEARAQRRSAESRGDVEALVRARAEEIALTRRLSEVDTPFDPGKHPRDRIGRFLDSLKVGEKRKLGEFHVLRTLHGFKIHKDEKKIETDAQEFSHSRTYKVLKIGVGALSTAANVAQLVEAVTAGSVAMQYHGPVGRSGHAISFDPKLHPRDRRGKFAKVLSALKHGESAKLPDGTTVTRTLTGAFHIDGSNGYSLRTRGADDAADRALHMGGFEDVKPHVSTGDAEDKTFPGEPAYRERHGLAGNIGTADSAVHHYDASGREKTPEIRTTSPTAKPAAKPAKSSTAAATVHKDASTGRPDSPGLLKGRTYGGLSGGLLQVHVTRRIRNGGDLSDVPQAVLDRVERKGYIEKTKPGSFEHTHGRRYKATKKGERFLDANEDISGVAITQAAASDMETRLEEAISARTAAQAAGNVDEIVKCRAIESEIARQMMEGKVLGAADRKKYATVVKNGEHKFPIPDASHAKAALARLNQSDLTSEEKAKVKRVAKAKLAEATHDQWLSECLDELDESDVVLGLVEAKDSLAKASTPEPFSTSKTSNWVARGGGLPPYIQHIAHDLMEKRGKSESQAIQMAIGIVKRWARGGGNVDANTKAAAAKAVAQWEALKAKSTAKKVKEAELQEAASELLEEMRTFNPTRHPRGRGGKFVNVLSKLTGTGPHRPLTSSSHSDLAPYEGKHGLTWDVDSEGVVSMRNAWKNVAVPKVGDAFKGGVVTHHSIDPAGSDTIRYKTPDGRSRLQYIRNPAMSDDARVRAHNAEMANADEIKGLRGKGFSDADIAKMGFDVGQHRNQFAIHPDEKRKATLQRELAGLEDAGHGSDIKDLSILDRAAIQRELRHPGSRLYKVARRLDKPNLFSDRKTMREELAEALGALLDDQASRPIETNYSGPVTSMLGGAAALLPDAPDMTDQVYLRSLPTAELARRIGEVWDDPNPKARMYMACMEALFANTIDGNQGSLYVIGFLSNAGEWQSAEAEAIKAELSRRIR